MLAPQNFVVYVMWCGAEKDVTRTDRDIPFFSKEWGPNMIKLHDILVTYSFYNFDIGESSPDL